MRLAFFKRSELARPVHVDASGFKAHPPLSAGESSTLLKRAAALLSSQIGTGVEVKFRPLLFRTSDLYRVTYRWPGIVRVYCDTSGALLAESQHCNPSARKPRRVDDLPLSVAHQHALLAAAAALIESTTRTDSEANFCPCLFGLTRTYRTTYKWPGIVRVFDLETGALLAQSTTGGQAGTAHQLEPSHLNGPHS